MLDSESILDRRTGFAGRGGKKKLKPETGDRKGSGGLLVGQILDFEW